MTFHRFLRNIRTENSGQDLAEYCLLTALLALVAAGIFVQSSGGIQAIWGTANTSLIAGNSATATQTGSPASASAPAGH
jgi:Flp pilus assembly pilin Flp